MGSSAAGILLLFIGVVALLALFTGNLERAVASIAGPAGGAAGLYNRARSSSSGILPGAYGEPVPPAAAGGPAAGRLPVAL